MTGQELQLLRQSANLCNQRNQILSQLNNLKSQHANLAKNIKSCSDSAVKAAGKEAAKNRFIPIYLWVLAMIAVVIPVFACGVVYMLAGITNEYFMLIGVGIGFVAFFIVLYFGRKWDLAKVRKKAEKEFLARQSSINARYQAQCDQLKRQIYPLSQQLSQINSKMRNPTMCNIPESDWYHGPQLVKLITGGRASTLQEAIQLQYLIEAKEASIARQQAAEEAARWKKIEDMMRQQEEDIAKDKAKFWDDMQKMALIGMLLSDD